MGIKLSLEEARALAESMEATGQDATEIRQTITELEKGHLRKKQGAYQEAQGVSPGETDDELVARMVGKTPVGGPGPCAICGKTAEKLYSGTCPACFKGWVLSTKRRS